MGPSHGPRPPSRTRRTPRSAPPRRGWPRRPRWGSSPGPGRWRWPGGCMPRTLPCARRWPLIPPAMCARGAAGGRAGPGGGGSRPLAGRYRLLSEVAGRAEPGSEGGASSTLAGPGPRLRLLCARGAGRCRRSPRRCAGSGAVRALVDALDHLVAGIAEHAPPGRGRATRPPRAAMAGSWSPAGEGTAQADLALLRRTAAIRRRCSADRAAGAHHRHGRHGPPGAETGTTTTRWSRPGTWRPLTASRGGAGLGPGHWRPAARPGRRRRWRAWTCGPAVPERRRAPARMAPDRHAGGRLAARRELPVVPRGPVVVTGRHAEAATAWAAARGAGPD